jgi:hypothetical protein
MAFGVITAVGAAFDSLERAEDGAADGFPEIDCVRALISPRAATAAEERAARLGVGADRVVVAAGTLSEDVYLKALAGSLGTGFETLDDTPPKGVFHQRRTLARGSGRGPVAARGRRRALSRGRTARHRRPPDRLSD